MKYIKFLSVLVTIFFSMTNVVFADNISIKDFEIKPGSTETVELALTNATLVKDFSVDIYLPDGLTFENNDASSVVFTDAVVGGDPKSGSIRKNGALRLVVYDGKIQPGKNVVIVTFDVTAAEDFESGVITTDMTQIGDDDEIPSISVNVRGVNATSIDNAIVNVENNAVVYDLVGRQVNANAKGILIKNGKKFIVK